MRTINTIKNISASLGTTIIIAILGFCTRKVFIDSLGTEYLGLNGLLQNVIGMLSLVEGGIGTSIVYNLYKPLAERNKPQIIALIQLYRKLYRYIALAVFVLSLFLYPFLDVFIKGGESLSYVSVVYFIFVANNLIGYLMADKWSLIVSDQKQYKLALISLGYQVLLNLIKIAILLYFKNYVAYLCVELLCSLGYNALIIRKVNKFYPYIRTRIKYEVPLTTKKNIIVNVKALFCHSIGGYLLHGIDNIILSTFIGVGVVGLYSNYTLLIGQLKSFMKPVLTNMKDSIGNLVATDTADRQYQVFNVIYLLNYWLVSVVIVLVYNTINPFIGWWLGAQYTLSEYVVIALCAYFFIDEIRSSVMMYKYVSGIFNEDKYVVFITALINLVLSIIFVHYWGITGVILASSVAVLSTASWNWPRLVFKNTFQRSVYIYYLKYLLYAGITILVCYVTRVVNEYLFESSTDFISIVGMGLVSVFIFALVNILLFMRTDEVGYLKGNVSFLKSRVHLKK